MKTATLVTHLADPSLLSCGSRFYQFSSSIGDTAHSLLSLTHTSTSCKNYADKAHWRTQSCARNKFDTNSYLSLMSRSILMLPRKNWLKGSKPYLSSFLQCHLLSAHQNENYLTIKCLTIICLN